MSMPNIVVLLFVLACTWTAVQKAVPRLRALLYGSETHRVLYVVDGDTIQCVPAGGGEEKRVRLLGVDAPESYDSDKLRRELWQTGESMASHLRRGEAAKAYMKSILPKGSRVELEYGSARKGYYDRTLAKVWLLDSFGQRKYDVGAEMLRAGHAVEN